MEKNKEESTVRKNGMSANRPGTSPASFLPPTVKRFWVIWRPGGSQPKVRHDTLASAQKEAARLCGVAPEARFIFFILSAIECYTKPGTAFKVQRVKTTGEK